MRRWMDRSRPLKMNDHQLQNKIASVMTVAGLRHGGQETALNSMIQFCLGHGMIIVGNCSDPLRSGPFPSGTLQFDFEEKIKFRGIHKDLIAKKTAQQLGERIVQITHLCKKGL